MQAVAGAAAAVDVVVAGAAAVADVAAAVDVAVAAGAAVWVVAGAAAAADGLLRASYCRQSHLCSAGYTAAATRLCIAGSVPP